MRQESLSADPKKWKIEQLLIGNEFRAVVTIGEGNSADVVVSLKIGILRGNECFPQYDKLMEIFADGIRMAAEKKDLL